MNAPLTCTVCGRVVLHCTPRCFSCGGTDRALPTLDELTGAGDARDDEERAEDSDEWTGAYSGGEVEGF